MRKLLKAHFMQCVFLSADQKASEKCVMCTYSDSSSIVVLLGSHWWSVVVHGNRNLEYTFFTTLSLMWSRFSYQTQCLVHDIHFIDIMNEESYSWIVMVKCLKIGMMNHKCVYKLCMEHFVFINTSNHASPAVCVAMEQGTELDPACVRLLSPHTSIEPWQIIVLFYLRDLWHFRSFS